MPPELHEQPERRRHPEAAAGLSIRDEHILYSFLARHEDYHLATKLHDKTLQPEDAYRILVESARDPKTDLPRAEFLQEVLMYEVSHAQPDQPVSLIVFDIDNFKAINTELTHVGADDVLKKVADILSAEVRPNTEFISPDKDNTVVRWGGEEFVIVLSGVDQRLAHARAERIRQRIEEELSAIRPDGQPITVSGGVAEYDGQHPSDWKKFLQAADEEVLAAKAAGKNRIFPENQKAA